MSFAPTLIVANSGIRIVAPLELTEELYRHFDGDGVACTIHPGENPNSRKIVFLSPYAIDKIVNLFRRWEAERRQM